MQTQFTNSQILHAASYEYKLLTILHLNQWAVTLNYILQ